MKRSVWVACVVAFMAAGGCSKKQEAGDGIVVHFWQFWDLAVIQPLVDQFEAAHPGVKVETEQLTWATGLEKIQAALASGTQPDVCELGSTWLRRFSYEGVLDDITTVYEAERESFLRRERELWHARAYALPGVRRSRVL